MSAYTAIRKGDKRAYSVARATADKLDQTHSDGELERLRERLDAQSALIGELVEHLLKKRAISLAWVNENCVVYDVEVMAGKPE